MATNLQLPPLCPVCGQATTCASVHAPFAYWRCTDCKTAHLHPQPSAEFLNDFYEKFHLSANDGGTFEHFEKRTAADFPAKAKAVAKQFLNYRSSEAPRVLDVGCGKGFFVQELLQLGFRAEGIDLSTRAVREGQRLGIEGLHDGRLEERTDWDQRFDAVTAWATVEHLPQPAVFLAAVRRILKPAGLLFLDTGLAGDLVDRWAPGLIQWYDGPQHLFVFSRGGMEKILKDSRFEIVEFDSHFERTPLRRAAKFLRNHLLAFTGTGLFKLALGQHAYKRMRMETKMPFGSLMFVIARLEGTA